MSFPPSSPLSLLSFEDIFFGKDQSNSNEQELDNVISKEPEIKQYNTRGRAKAVLFDQLDGSIEDIFFKEKEQEKEREKSTSQQDDIFDDLFRFFDEDIQNDNTEDDDNDQDNNQRTDPLVDIQSISIHSPSKATETNPLEKNASEVEIEEGVEHNNISSDVEMMTSDNQEPSKQSDNQTNNNNSSKPPTQPKRHSLRKRNDIQLHPYSLEKAKYMSLLRRAPKTRTARDRVDDYIDPSQYIQQQQDDEDDPDFVPGQENIPTQSESIIQETQEWDSNVLILPKPRTKAPTRQNNNTTTNNTITNTTNITAQKSNDKSSSIVQSLLDKEESVSKSSHYLQTDPLSSLPPLSNTKGKHRIIHTFKRKNNRHPKTYKPTNTSSVFDFDPEPHDLFKLNNDDMDDDMDDDDEEEMLQLSKKRSKKRRVIISDSEEEEEDMTSTERKRRRNDKPSLLEPNSVAQFEEMVNSSSQAQEVRPRRTHRRQKSDDDVVPIVQDENELKTNENRRIRLTDIATNKRSLHGILPQSFANVYRSQLQEEQNLRQARRSVPEKRRPVTIEEENTPVKPILHVPVDIFSDEEDDDKKESTEQQNTYSNLYTQSQNINQFDEAIEYNESIDPFIYEPVQNTKLMLPSRHQRSSQSSAAMEYNRIPNHYQRQPKKTSNSQTTRKRRRRHIHKTTDDIYIRPSRRYWNDETIDRMLLRQGKQHPQQQTRSHDDISIGPSCFNPTTNSHGIRITWIHNMEDYLKNAKSSNSHTIKALKEREEKRLSTVHQYKQAYQQDENITVASVLERVGDLVDADLRTTVGLLNTVYLHHKLLPSLLSGARNKKKYFERFKTLLENPVIYNARIIWKDVVPAQLKLIRGWFWRAFYDITTAFQSEQATIDSTFYVFTSVCIARWIPTLPGDTQIAMVKIYNTEARIFASQICDYVMQSIANSPFIPWKVVLEAMLFTLDWKCRLLNLGSDEGVWPLTDLTSSLIHLLVQIGPERITMGSTSYVSEAWICLLQIMSVSTDIDGYRFSEKVFLEQLEKWIDDKAAKETWSKSFKTQSMKQWAIAFKHIFDKYML